MKVAWVTEYPTSNFLDREKLKHAKDATSISWVTLQAPLVAARQIELHVVTISKYVAADDEFVDGGVHFHVLKIPNVPRVLLGYQLDRLRIVRCLRRIKPDVVHGFGTEASFGYAAASSGYPSVVMIQGIIKRIAGAGGILDLLRRPALCASLAFERVTVRRCRHFVCETLFAAEFVREYNPEAVVHLIRTPISDAWFGVARQVEADGLSEVLFVGRASAAKGIEVLLEAFPIVLREFPRAFLHIVGACDPRYLCDTLGPAIRRRGIEEHVRFHGYQPAAFIAERLSRAAVLALPTIMDTAPNVLAEARAAGVPVVASAVGGIPELITDGVDGLLVPARSSEALADAIRGLLRDRSAARRMAERGRRRVFEEHQAAVQVSKLIEVYREIVASEVGGA